MGEVPLYAHVRASSAAAEESISGCRGTSLIRNQQPPHDHHRALGITLP